MDIDKLQTELAKPAYVGLDYQSAADALNTPTIVDKQGIPAHDIKRYLTLVGKRAAIAADPAGAAATHALDDFTDFDMSDSAVDAALIAVLDGLVAANLLVDGDKTAILAMGDTLISVAESEGISNSKITAGHVQAARWRMI